MAAHQKHQREVSNTSEDWRHCLEVCLCQHPFQLISQPFIARYNLRLYAMLHGAWIMNSFSSSLGPVSMVGSHGLAIEVDIQVIQHMWLIFSMSW